MSLTVPCVLMRAGTSRGPFFLREWLPADEAARDEALIGAIGASDLLQLDGVGGGSTLTSKVAIVSRSLEPGCDVDYLFAQVGVGQRSVDTRPNCGNMLAGVGPFAIEQGLVTPRHGETTVRVFNVNTRARIDVTVQTPGGRVVYEGTTRIDGVAGTAAPIRLDFRDAWGAVTGAVFPTGRRIDIVEGVDVTCLDTPMPLVILRARDLGVTGREAPEVLDANGGLLARLERIRRAAGQLMGLGDVAESVVPKPVLVSEGDGADSVTSRYFTPLRCHSSHAVTGAIGVATAFALPGTVASDAETAPGRRRLCVLHPQGRIEIDVDIAGAGDQACVQGAALVRTARKILQGDLYLPDYVFSRPANGDAAWSAAPALSAPVAHAYPDRLITVVVPTTAGGGNDALARVIAQPMGALLTQQVIVDNRPGANGSIASEYVARARPDGHTLMFGYIATHAMNPALQALPYDALEDFEPVALVGWSPTVLVTGAGTQVEDVRDLVVQLKARPGAFACASAGIGTAPHFAAELFKLATGTTMSHVPYKGSSPALADTIDGRTQVMFPSLFSALPFVHAGALRALAVAGANRSAALPGVPTLAEAGVEGVDVTQWYAFFAPAGTPAPIVERLNRTLKQALATPDAARRIAEQGVDVKVSTPAELRALVQAELTKWRGVVHEAKLKPD